MKLRTQVLLHLFTMLSVLAIVLTHSSFAAISANPTLSNQTTTISYQGTLNDSLGQPISGATPMIFKLYSGPAGGTSLWTETRSGNNAVAVNQGLFHVLLGSLSPLDVQLATQTLWLGISVNGDAEMTPRSQLASVPFAAVAGTVPNGSVTSEKIKPLVGSRIPTENIFLTLPNQAWQPVAIPTTKLEFTVTQPSKIMIWYSVMLQSVNQNIGDRDAIVRLDNNVIIAVSSIRQQKSGVMAGTLIIDVDPGVHSLDLMINSNLINDEIFIESGRANLTYLVVSQ